MSDRFTEPFGNILDVVFKSTEVIVEGVSWFRRWLWLIILIILIILGFAGFGIYKLIECIT